MVSLKVQLLRERKQPTHRRSMRGLFCVCQMACVLLGEGLECEALAALCDYCGRVSFFLCAGWSVGFTWFESCAELSVVLDMDASSDWRYFDVLT